MRRLASIFLAVLLFSQPALALDAKTLNLMKDMDCTGYDLSNINQRGPLPGNKPRWLVVNEGPSSIVIWASNGAMAGVVGKTDTYDHITLFAGDRRYKYTAALRSPGKARIYFCIIP